MSQADQANAKERAIAIATSIAMALVVGGVMEAAADNLQQSTQPTPPSRHR